MIAPIDSSQSAAGAAPDAAHKSALDKEAFLKLLVAQLSHQDPLQPTEGTEFVAQLSQFAMVEQAIAQSQKLDSLSAQMRGLGNGEAAKLVGETVTVQGHGIAFDGLNATSAGATFDGPATKVTVEIADASGKVVRTMELGARPRGPSTIAWDGRDDAGLPVPKGNYDVRVKAEAADGSPVGVSQDVTGRVTKVSFEKGYPELLLDSGVSASISDLISVGGNVR